MDDAERQPYAKRVALMGNFKRMLDDWVARGKISAQEASELFEWINNDSPRLPIRPG